MIKEWFLVALVFGVEVERSKLPMTIETCTLQAAYKIIEIEQYVASGQPIPEKYGGERCHPIRR